MAYSYNDFVSAANKAGLMKEFSEADLRTAQRYPEFGMSILGFKQDIHKAATPEAKLLAHQSAEELRKSYGSYSGGQRGDQYLYSGRTAGTASDILDQIAGFQPAENPYKTQYQAALDKIGSFGEFSYGEAPTYSNQYQEQQKALLDAIINREDFSWSKDTDPLWPVYKKEYLREGERATADALGQAAAASGGRPSTAAVTAATQAGDYYATKLNDVIPTLYQQAYDKYLNEYQMKLSDLGAVNGQEQLDYAKYLDQMGQYNTDRGFSYQKYLDDFARQLQGLDALESAQRLHSDQGLNDFSILQGKLGSLQSQDSVDYGRYLDQITRQDQQREADRTFWRDQLDTILAAGGTPSAAVAAGSGVDQTYINALRDAALRGQAAQSARKASGSSGGSGGGKPRLTLAQVQSAIKNGQVTDAVIRAYDYYMGEDGAYQRFFGGEGQGAGGGIANAGKRAAALKMQLRTIPGLTEDNKVAMIEDAWNNGRITEEEAAELLDYIGSGGKSGDRSSLDYRPDEGIFTWNGKSYSSVERLLNDIDAANLSSSELSALKRKFKSAGFDLG